MEGGGVFIGGHRSESIGVGSAPENSRGSDAVMGNCAPNPELSGTLVDDIQLSEHFTCSMTGYQMERVRPGKTRVVTDLFRVKWGIER
jgi:hypothetical protein